MITEGKTLNSVKPQTDAAPPPPPPRPGDRDELEQLIRERTQELPPDMSRVILEMVLMFIADPGAKSLSLTKIEGEEKTHYHIDLN